MKHINKIFAGILNNYSNPRRREQQQAQFNRREELDKQRSKVKDNNEKQRRKNK